MAAAAQHCSASGETHHRFGRFITEAGNQASGYPHPYLAATCGGRHCCGPCCQRGAAQAAATQAGRGQGRAGSRGGSSQAPRPGGGGGADQRRGASEARGHRHCCGMLLRLGCCRALASASYGRSGRVGSGERAEGRLHAIKHLGICNGLD